MNQFHTILSTNNQVVFHSKFAGEATEVDLIGMAPIGQDPDGALRQVESRALVQGHSPALEAAFACSGPFWGRYYFFWHDRKPLTLIYEVFSPEIQKYLNHTDQR